MHVLALVTDAFGGHGGIARYNRELAGALAALDDIESVTLLPRLAAQPLERLPAKVRQLPAIYGRGRYSLAALRVARRMPQGTVVLCGHLLMAPLAASLVRVIGGPLWLQVHGVEAWRTPSRAVRWGAEQADLVTSVSRCTRQRMLAAWWGADPNRIRVLPNTVDAAFRPGPKPHALIERYGLEGCKVLLTVARLSTADREKGHDRVIAALPGIIARHPEALYLIVGDGDDEPRLRSLVARLGLDDHVQFTGRIPSRELPDHYRAANVFIMPSTKEGFGIVFLEAAASGLHVIGGNRDGSVDALRDGAIGEAINPLNIDEIAAAVCRALEAPVRLDAARVEAFSQANFRKQVAALIDRLARSRQTLTMKSDARVAMVG